MEDENFLVGGKQLHELRVVDLKKECDRNKLPKNGTKRELIERLKAVGILSAHIEINSDYFSKRKGCFPLLRNVSLRQSSWFEIISKNINIAAIVNAVFKSLVKPAKILILIKD